MISSNTAFSIRSLFRAGIVRRTFSSSISSTQQPTSPSYTPNDLPSETLFLLDGTAMLFYAYYSNASRTKFKEAAFTHTFSQQWLARQSTNTLERFKEAAISQSETTIEATVPLDLSQLSCSALSAMMFNFAYFINQFQPNYLAVAFDSKATTFRKSLYPEYKSQRKQSPVELMPQMEVAPTIFESLGCKCFQVDGYEADDIMAALGSWARGRGLNVVHVSVDKDMLQLIDEGVHVMDPRSNRIVGKDDVVEKFGVLPSQICDLFALTGDEVDNVPGVRRFGAKTAKAFIQHFHSIDNLYQSLGFDSLPPLPTHLTPLINDFNNKENQKQLWSYVEETLPKEELNRILTLMKDVCKEKGIKKKPESLLLPLFITPFNEVKLFKHLIQLRTNVPLEYLIPKTSQDLAPIISSTTTSSSASFSTQLNDRETLKVEVEKETTTTTMPKRVAQPKEVLTSTNDLRYRGEKKFQQKVIDQHLVHALSESFSTPLQYLRQSYHKLDRD